jgi:predicted dehydrogenase
MSKKITFALVGAGSRGLDCFGKYILQDSENVKIVAVAEPREFQRNEAVRRHEILPAQVFSDWQEMLAKPRLADAVIITTTDRVHMAPAIAAAEKGYHILLEKPMAPTARECIRIVETCKKNHVMLSVCHGLRYAPYYVKIKEFLNKGILGEVCTIQHLEGVAWWHQAHAFVRGNFGNESRSSFMLLAKCCHDMDLLRWWIGKKCLAVSSFGYLKHFRKDKRPAGAADRCMDCSLADAKCSYSAKKIYFQKLQSNELSWPLNMVIDEMTPEALDNALRTGPYGRCVYACDNDVVDHQVVNLSFEDDITASFTMTAFTPPGRKTRIMGSLGYLEGDENIIRVFDYNTEQWTEFDINKFASEITDGHGGGDQRLIHDFIFALQTGDPSLIKTGPDITLESHLMVFAAEKSRRTGKTVQMKRFGVYEDDSNRSYSE